MIAEYKNIQMTSGQLITLLGIDGACIVIRFFWKNKIE